MITRRSVTVSKTIAAAGNYTIGDIVSESATNGEGTAWEFQNIGPSGQLTTLLSGFLTCSEDSVTARYRLHLFKSNPADSELDDNAAKNFAADDRAKGMGYVDFEAASDQGAYSMAKSSSVPFDLNLETSHVYGVLEDLSGETAESANMVISITLNAEFG